MSDPDVLKEKLQELHATLDRVENDARVARDDIAQNGISALITVGNSSGVMVEKMGINPSCRVLTTAERMARVLKREIKAIESEQKAAASAAKRAASPLAKFVPTERNYES